MIKKLWFLTHNEEVIAVFDDRDIAIEERIYLKEENPLDEISLQGLGLAELGNYPDEYEMAKDRGYLDEQ